MARAVAAPTRRPSGPLASRLRSGSWWWVSVKDALLPLAAASYLARIAGWHVLHADLRGQVVIGLIGGLVIGFLWFVAGVRRPLLDRLLFGLVPLLTLTALALPRSRVPTELVCTFVILLAMQVGAALTGAYYAEAVKRHRD